jgi:glycerol-3-phosphate dehydrogenase
MPDDRNQRIDRDRRNGAFDVIVVGGGINGIGVFHDLAQQGVRVLLVEMNDFCSGCSAAPSRMIHGGLRYLENGEFSLVRESLPSATGCCAMRRIWCGPCPRRCRSNALPRALPMRPQPLGLHRADRPRGALPIKLGLVLYDAITGKGRMLPATAFTGRAATRAAFPALRPSLRFSATYHDAWISHPERLGIELIGDAMARNPEALA